MNFYAHMRYFILVAISASMLITTIQAQQDYRRAGELIIELAEGEDLSSVIPQHRRAANATKCLSDRRNIYRLSYPQSENLAQKKLVLEELSGVLAVQYNHTLKRRSGSLDPNDPLFSEQWYLDRIGATALWEQTTGGLTPCGDTIVVAVFDFGLDEVHEDLSQQIWYNHQEIANNDFDDDGNGYVDDFAGLNLDTGDDQHQIDTEYHGTAVASVIGAVTNNEKGIAGVNWNVKLMIVSSADKDEALAIEAFEYIINQRKKYNESNGTEGAYVVAVNNSWGREGFFEEDFPILCSMFDDLGEVGILSVGSTENDQANTDVFGDIPSDCSSDYLIVVTNTDENDELSVAAWGAENVDLGAPGERIRVLSQDNGYGFDSGTSFSTPLVTGGIGLLYSLPQATFCDDAALSPTDAILNLKRYILESVTPAPTLQGKTVSGGILNISSAADLVTNVSDEDTQNIQLYPNPSENFFTVLGQEIRRVEVFNVLGQVLYHRDMERSTSDPISINASGWPGGTYFIKVNNRNSEQTLRAIKY